ncbi:MAG: glycosyltransferase, exosortase A system-associated [Gammaproteobacteria bacterium]|nr:glycosyltransferase, exosortase A system-associated [Gammaproteobacteria bacterium]
MRILHVFDHSLPVQSGYAFRSAAILREQRRLGWETLQVTGPKQGPATGLVEDFEELRFHRTPPATGMAARLPVLDQLAVVSALKRRIAEIVRSEKPDILHAHSPCLDAMAAFGHGKPVVYELRSSWEDAAVSSGVTTEGSLRYRASRWLETRALHRADAITTICEGLRRDVILRGIPGDKITVVPNSVHVPAAPAAGQPDGESQRDKYGLRGCCVVAFIGSFFAWEGLVSLIEALPLVLQQRPDARLLLVGAGPDEAAMRAAAARCGVEAQVIFAGQVPHREVAALYAMVDVLAYPRLPMRLTEMVTPLKPLEAMAMRKVFVASDVGGHRELVEDGVTGLLFKAGDRAALAAALLRAADDAALRARLVDAGFRHVSGERSWARAVQQYVPVYTRLMQGLPGGRS